MIQTKWFCDLCGRQIEELRTSLMHGNVTLYTHEQPDQRDYHICEDCVANLNPYELVEELCSRVKTPPGFKAPTVWSIRVSTTRYKILSVGEK